MNDKRRKIIREAMWLVDQAKALVGQARDEEEEYRDNMPENLQESERYERADEVVGKLEECLEGFDEISGALEEAVE